MSNDSIRRSDALKVLSIYGWTPIDGLYDTFAHDIPSADRPQGEWIPCSERLPEYRKLVLVTTRDLRVKPAYLDSIQDDGTDDWWSIPLDDADCASWNIVAWMPLPKPWKGAANERL